MSYPNLVRPGHKWLGPLLDYLDKGLEVAAPSGTSGAQAAWLGRHVAGVQVGNATGVVGLYGATGIAPLATGTAGITGLTGAGGMTAFSMVWINGGSGAYYTLPNIVTALKNAGILLR